MIDKWCVCADLATTKTSHKWTIGNIKSVQFGHKWKISEPGITINNPVANLMRTTINLVTQQMCNPRIVKCNPWYTYSPPVPKRDTFMLLMVHLWNIACHRCDQIGTQWVLQSTENLQVRNPWSEVRGPKSIHWTLNIEIKISYYGLQIVVLYWEFQSL